MIKAQVIADSKNQFGNRITTMIVTMPRYILAEFNTHRMFSRNSASSRAIPFEKMVKSIEDNPFIPMAWMKDHKGMQGTEYAQYPDTEDFKVIWLEARDNAIKSAQLAQTGSVKLTKQLCNRLLEPFMWHTVIVTATEWENFFALRCPQYLFTNETTSKTFRSKKDCIKFAEDQYLGQGEFLKNYSNLDWLKANQGQADIHMMATAESMWDALNESTPKDLKEGEWHIPFGDDISYDLSNWKFLEKDLWGKDMTEFAIKIATARCARVSYTVVGEEDKPANYENDIKLHDRLAASGHWSPMEHCAKSMSDIDLPSEYGGGWSGNFCGFIQYRKTFNNENITK